MTFEEYLISKKIDRNLFKNSDSDLFHSWENMFNQIHPLSFTEQNKFIVNKIRRKYPIKEDPST
jgi:hypothetical protein